jgi:hypothetical protein
MARPLKFHQTLNLQPRSVTHGKHRRTSPPAYGDPVDRTDHGTGGADPRVVTIRPGGITWVPVTFASTFAVEPKPEPIPYAGIRTGELIGHRLWWVIEEAGEQWICSLAHRRLWQPSETVRGDLKRPVIFSVFCTVYGGVYAFATADQYQSELDGINLQIAHFDLYYGHLRKGTNWGANWFADWVPYAETSTVVAGTVKMWGDVMEHERGYRAEFAKLNSIDAMHGPGDLDALRARYGVASEHV